MDAAVCQCHQVEVAAVLGAEYNQPILRRTSSSSAIRADRLPFEIDNEITVGHAGPTEHGSSGKELR
jgi:hypothetical protein